MRLGGNPTGCEISLGNPTGVRSALEFTPGSIVFLSLHNIILSSNMQNIRSQLANKLLSEYLTVDLTYIG